MNKFGEMFEEKCGKVSAMRVAMFVYLVPLVFSWTFVSISENELQSLDNSLITGLGLLIGGKSIQHFSENKTIEAKP